MFIQPRYKNPDTFGVGIFFSNYESIQYQNGGVGHGRYPSQLQTRG